MYSKSVLVIKMYRVVVFSDNGHTGEETKGGGFN